MKGLTTFVIGAVFGFAVMPIVFSHLKTKLADEEKQLTSKGFYD
jgi:hypothetical protein